LGASEVEAGGEGVGAEGAAGDSARPMRLLPLLLEGAAAVVETTGEKEDRAVLLLLLGVDTAGGAEHRGKAQAGTLDWGFKPRHCWRDN